jgi:hypothetical protein
MSIYGNSNENSMSPPNVGNYGANPDDLDSINDAAYYAMISREWAVSPELVDDGHNPLDDSSRTWAERAKEYVDSIEYIEATAYNVEPGGDATADYLEGLLTIGVPEGLQGAGLVVVGSGTIAEIYAEPDNTPNDVWFVLYDGLVPNDPLSTPEQIGFPVYTGDAFIWTEEGLWYLKTFTVDMSDYYTKEEIDLSQQEQDDALILSLEYQGELNANFATIPYVDDQNNDQDEITLDLFTGDELEGEADEFASVEYVDDENDAQDAVTEDYTTGVQLTGETL